ncbi:MAG: chloride channel protein, partial [Alphaproteobacteria bacterium]|nr:chloride channel protein [Alphaproteobacteria bacterium]
AALAYTRLIAWATRGRPRGGAGTAAVALSVFLGLGLASLVFPQLLGNGRGVVQRTISGQFGPLPVVLAVLALRPVATALCLKSGAPGGLFTPTLTVGSLLGLTCGRLWSWVVTPGLAPNGSYAVIGAGAFLAACTGGPISTLVIMLELGRHIDLLIVPLGAAIVSASLVVRLFDAPSIYTARLSADLERANPAEVAAEGPLADEIATDVLVIASASSAIRTVQKLIATGSPSAYVVDETGALVGRLDPGEVRRWAAAEGPRILETARDLSRPASCIGLDAAPDEARAELQISGLDELAVVDPKTRRLAGVLRLRR